MLPCYWVAPAREENLAATTSWYASTGVPCLRLPLDDAKLSIIGGSSVAIARELTLGFPGIEGALRPVGVSASWLSLAAFPGC